MTLADFANIGNLLGGVGVIISLIYLAIQIRMNTEQARAAAHTSRSNQAFELLRGTSPAFMQIDLRVSNDAPDLDPVELRQFYDFQLARFHLFQDDHLLHQRKMIDDEAFAQTRRTIEAIVRNPAIRRVWRMSARFYRPEFCVFMDSIVSDVEQAGAAYVHTRSLLEDWKAMIAAEAAAKERGALALEGGR